MDLDWSAILGGRHEAPPLQSGVLTACHWSVKRFYFWPIVSLFTCSWRRHWDFLHLKSLKICSNYY